MSDQESEDNKGALFSASRRTVIGGLTSAAAAAVAGIPGGTFAETPSPLRSAVVPPAKDWQEVARRAKAKGYFARYQWSLIDLRGRREFPGWLGGAPEVWAYTEKMSYLEGESVDLLVHTNTPAFDVRIVRDGEKQALAFEKSGVRGIVQKTPENASVVGCGWKPALAVSTKGWAPGVYIAHFKCRDAKGAEGAGEHMFVVQSRQPGSHSKIVFVMPTSTYQAYNDWGGANNYRSIREGLSTDVLEPRISTQRPWARGFVALPPGAPDYLEPTTPPIGWKPAYLEVNWALANDYSRHYVEGYANSAPKFMRWADRNGYVMEYATQHDLHERPELFDAYTTMVIVGHDEYWTWEMRDTIDRFVDRGGKIARFAGNFWGQIRLENDNKTHICYKTGGKDPVQGARNTELGFPEERPMASSLGVHATGYSRYGAANPRSMGGYTVYRPWHWSFEGTDLYYGDVFGAAPLNIHGFETDGLDYVIKKGLPYPDPDEKGVPEGLQMLALAPSVSGEVDRFKRTVPLNAPLDYGRREGQEREMIEPGADLPAGAASCGAIVYFERGKGAVYTAGSCVWVRGLEANDPMTSRITKNVLDRFSKT
ncbi:MULTISPECIES: N,N-dimethylformamidase beta subunit family domain-containing protein [unclassified Sphingobium]|uniref:N,N-dimethylformamidase beta subunit family domain-containing protein n=1 Tax=unclassified Sphingobium TaxID=2611147 RepID=UPI002223F897|nr:MULTISPECIES: N,N-dimethylformamidase beta subunit family domain-containing protein [unclassified Sphingobium]MCW2395771.1 hypothetical protein [Sphingobium sp. B8D3B]MCW2419286.1 hypothetical protein [Sphingobium sp. B8D3C]